MGFFSKVLTFIEPPGVFIAIALFLVYWQEKGERILKWITLAVIIYFFHWYWRTLSLALV